MSAQTLDQALTELGDAAGFSARDPLVARILLTVLRWVPRSAMSLAASVLALLMPIVARRESRRLFANLQAIYGLPRHSSFAKDFAEQVARHTSHCQIETMKLVANDDVSHLDGIEALRATMLELMVGGRGVLIVTAHLGSWEMVAQAVAAATGKPFFALAKPPSRHWARPVLQALRRSMNTVILWTDRTTLVRDMMTVARNSGALGFVMDQKPRGGKGCVVPFFGIQTPFVQGPATLAVKTQAAVVAVFCLRVGPWQYRVVHRVLDIPPDDGSPAETWTALMAAEIESMIRCFPEQWTWNYRRWNDEQLAGAVPMK